MGDTQHIFTWNFLNVLLLNLKSYFKIKLQFIVNFIFNFYVS